MKHFTRSIAVAAALGAAALLGAVSPLTAHDPHHTVVHAEEIKWGPAPASLPAGAQAAALLGSPAKEGPFVLRLKLPKGFVIAPHRHTKDEFVTVISGSFHVTAGEQVDRSAKGLKSSGFIHLPSGMPHFAFTSEETVVQINGTGPFDVVYIDPKDDPRKK
jgi:quercetin dioxygenase-like cupin family protein